MPTCPICNEKPTMQGNGTPDCCEECAVVIVAWDVYWVGGFSKGLTAYGSLVFPTMDDARAWIEGVQLRLIGGEKLYSGFRIL